MSYKVNIRSGVEIEGLREAGAIASNILKEVSENIVSGITTKDLDNFSIELFKKYDCQSAFLGYMGFPGNICVSINEEVVHGIGSSRVIKDGDIIKIDVGVKTKKGWIGDNAKSIPVGKIDDKAKKLLTVTEESLYESISHAKSGNKLSSICSAVERYVSNHGFSVVKEFVGHGVGKELHENPQIPNYWNRKEMRMKGFRDIILRKGMVLAIEPMVNLGTSEVLICNDNWTVITKDKMMSSHFEHTVLIREEDEAEILTPRDRLKV